MLKGLLLDWFDDEMKEDWKEFGGELSSIKQKQIDVLNFKAETTKDMSLRSKYIRQAKMGYLDPNSDEGKQYIDDKHELYEALFESLLLLFGRKRYLIAEAIRD